MIVLASLFSSNVFASDLCSMQNSKDLCIAEKGKNGAILCKWDDTKGKCVAK